MTEGRRTRNHDPTPERSRRAEEPHRRPFLHPAPTCVEPDTRPSRGGDRHDGRRDGEEDTVRSTPTDPSQGYPSGTRVGCWGFTCMLGSWVEASTRVGNG